MPIFYVHIDGQGERLIEAETKRAAVQYALPSVIEARKATADDVARVGSDKLDSAIVKAHGEQ